MRLFNYNILWGNKVLMAISITLLLLKRSYGLATPKPLLFLDIDGVLNSFRLENPWGDNRICFVENPLRKTSYKINHSPTLNKKINKLSKSVDIEWLTTWDEAAKTNIAPALKLNDFPLARDPKLKLSKEKAAKIRAESNEDRPIIWVDDELDTFTYYLEYWKKRKAVLFVCTGQVCQITPEDILKIEEFIEDPTSNNV